MLRRKKEEEEPETTYITYTAIFNIRWQYTVKTSWYISRSYEHIYKRFKELTRRDGLSPSRVLCELMREWVNKHEPGNPQRPLFPDQPFPHREFERPPLRWRAGAMADLLATIRRNPHVPIDRIIAAFSYETGLSMKRVREYVDQLRKAGKLRGRRLY